MNAINKLILVALLFIPTVLFCQEWKEKYNEYLLLFQETKYDDAILKSDDLLKSIGIRDTNYANTLYYLQYCFFYKEDFPKAIKAALSEREIRKEISGTSNPNYQNSTYNAAVFYSYIAQYDSSVILMEEVIDYAKNQYGSENEYYLNTVLQLANVFYLAGSIKQAEIRYDEVYGTVKRIYSDSSVYYMQVVNTVAPFYFNTGNYEKAEPFYVNATKSLYITKGELSQDYILSLNSLGEFYLRASMFDKAETTFQEFVYVCEKFYGKKSADYATALNNLAVVFEKKGKNKEAEEYYLKSLEIKGKVFKKESDFYALTLSNLAVLYDNMGRYDEAKQILEQVISIYKAIYGEENPNYANALNSLASIYSSYGKYNESIELFEKAMEIQKKTGGEKYDAYINSLNNLALTHEEIGETDKAEAEFEKIISLRKELQGDQHDDYAISLYNLGNIKMQKGNYSLAGQLFYEALEIHRKNFGELHSSYANTLNSIASLYSYKGNFNEAEKIYDQCEQIYLKIYGPIHPEYAVYLNNLGNFYYESGNYDKGELVLNKALKIMTDAFGDSHPDNAQPLSNLSNIMIAKGNYRQAEIYLTESLKILEENYGQEHFDYATGLMGLGVFYYNTGNYKKAETYYLQVLEIYKKTVGENHSEYSTALNNTGALYLSMAIDSDDPAQAGIYAEKSEQYFLNSLRIDSVVLGTNHPNFATHINNLGEMYRNTGQFDKAEQAFLKTMEIERTTFGENSPNLAITFHNLSLLYAGNSEYNKAEEYGLKALKIKEETFGTENPACSGTMSSLAWIYENSSRPEVAKNYYLKALSMNYNSIASNFSFLSEEEKNNYLSSVNHYNDMFLSFATKYQNNDPELFGTIYNNELIYKGILLRSTSRMKNSILNSKDEGLISLYNDWISMKQEISKLNGIPVNQRTQDITFLEVSANLIEKKLVAANSEFSNNMMLKSDWKEIRNSLEKDEAAIEFMQVKKLNENNYENDYYAVVLLPDSTAPVLTFLCHENELNDLLKGYSGDNIKYLIKVYNSESEINKKLYAMIWEPLEKIVNNKQTVYYAPAGIINKLSLSCIHHPERKYLSAKYQLVQMTSTAKLSEQKSENIAGKNSRISIYGGSLFSTDTINGNIEQGWKYLEGTREEADKIAILMNKSKMTAEVFTGLSASEDNFKKADDNGSPDIIHIATHGFFYPDPKENKIASPEKQETQILAFRSGNDVKMDRFSFSANPLMRSGLVFSGANDIIKINGTDEDGILSAYEVSDMNLSDTRLVVMSACETGLGDIKGSEGVYGLQRAFKMAGVKYIIMSLWQVPDKETSEFMITFYSELLKTVNVRKAFYLTQKQMRDKYDPYFWGAFVLTE